MAPLGEYRQLARMNLMRGFCALSITGSIDCFTKGALEIPEHIAPANSFGLDMFAWRVLENENFEEIAVGKLGVCGRTTQNKVHCNYFLDVDREHDPTPIELRE
jgi:hypothetical protein